ncbi:biosynthetic peptidoglycan transglycosylase [Microcystis phage MaAM05]|nr:biosynthetic peptidoglycan transglycosylase [Microcystis phage MaAM05]
MADRQFELPVDVRRKSEVVQDRLGLIILITTVSVFTFLIFLLSVLLGNKLAEAAAALPNVKVLHEWHPYESTRIYDRNGTLIANIHGDEDRVVVPLKDISPNIQRAVMAIEDNRFYEHNGVDIRGTLRAASANFRGEDVQGGSTLTQQLVKNLFLSPERAITRKVAEALLAMRVERHYDKNKILEMYLNQVYWGNQSYGIEKAARRYFKKPARDLTIGESALLAGLLKAPEGISPYAYPKAARKRQLEVLGAMVTFGYITEEQRAKAASEPLELNRQLPKPSKHPFFIQYVVEQLKEKFGDSAVRQGGLKVYTTMDQPVQELAEKALYDEMDKIKYSGASEGSFIVQNLSNGHILALVGGRDFEKNQFNHATQQHRAIGSTFKPLVYLTAFRLGLVSPESQISDSPVCFNNGYSNWCPHNWDGRYMGPMTIRKALTLSRNTPTVKLGLKMGIDPVIETARLAGITSPIDANFSSLLGSAGISPLEVITAYSTIARGGIYLPPTVLMKVEDSRGREIHLERPQPERRFEAGPVYNLISILQDVVEKGTGKNAIIPGRAVAGKTGTTDEMRDIWFSGFTADMVGSVWMGNDKYVPLRGVFSSNSVTVWGNFAREYYKMYPIQAVEFPKPPKILVEKKYLGPKQESSETAALETDTPAVAPSAPSAKAPAVDDPAYGYSPLHPGAGGIPMNNDNNSGELKPLIDPNASRRPAALAAPLPTTGGGANTNPESGVH